VRRRSAGLCATLGLGFATLISLAATTLSGILLTFYYVPSVEQAHASLQDLISVISLGSFVRNLHRWSAHAAVLFCLLHLLRTLLWGSYRGPHRRIWLVGVGLLVVLLATSFSGYLLPWDQDAYWTVTVGTSLVGGYVPLIGGDLMRLLLGGAEVAQPALTRFFAFHLLALPALGLLLLVLHFFRLRRADGLAHGGEACEGAEDLVPAGPLLFRRQLILALALCGALVLISVFVDTPLGPSPDVIRPDNPPKAPWFLVGIQEMVSYSARLGGFLFPALLLAVLALGPWLDGNEIPDGSFLPRSRARLTVGAGILLSAGATIISVLWWGDPRDGTSSWLNPASIAGVAAVVIPAVTLLAGRNRSLAYQSLITGLLAALVVFSVVGWYWRGPDWALTFHPGPGRGLDTQIRASADVAAPSEVIQMPTPTNGVDRCPTCHRATLPGSKPGIAAPLKAHPKIEGHSDLSRFGCTPCHGGQGRRLDLQAHRPLLGGGLDPFLDRPLIRARCARCHVPTGLAGSPALDRGFQEYLDAGCTGCHQPGRREEGLGPDLRRLGRRTGAEIRKALLDPREGHGQAMMWSSRRRYNDKTPEGRVRLNDLVTALLAISDSPAPYWSAWAKPDIRWNVDCQACHLASSGRKALGRAHRCTMLRQYENLRCPRCHEQDTTRPPSRGRKGVKSQTCPQVQAARPLCPVCHLRRSKR